MNVGVREQCAGSIPARPEGNSAECVFVSTSLGVWTTAEPERFARDFQIDDTVYRRLDPEYYAWLRSRMARAKNAAAAGQLDAGAFEHLRVRFNAVHQWAVEHLGEEQLRTAERAFRACDYAPPVAEPERPRAAPSRRRERDEGRADAARLVDAIREEALAAGWKHERLYGSGGNISVVLGRGLVDVLRPGDRIGEITARSIEVIGPPPTEVRQRFYNPDVEQP